MQGKVCPTCGRFAALNAPSCQGCGHVYRTNFGAAPPAPTMQFNAYQPAPGPGVLPPGYVQFAPGTYPYAWAVVSALVCGGWLTCFINRQYEKGLVFLLGSMVLAVVTGGVSVLVTYPATLIDALLITGRLSRGEVVRRWQMF